MTILKTTTLAITLLAGAASLAMAQAQGSSGPDGQVTTSATAAENPQSQPALKTGSANSNQ